MLALAAHHIKAFNANLYIVVATVDPVLIIALIVPGGPIHSIIAGNARSPGTAGRILFWFYLSISCLYVLLFIVGEYGAVTALDSEHASHFQHAVASSSATTLPLALGLLLGLQTVIAGLSARYPDGPPGRSARGAR